VCGLREEGHHALLLRLTSTIGIVHLGVTGCMWVCGIHAGAVRGCQRAEKVTSDVGKDTSLIEKVHFFLTRMNVHVHVLRWHLQREKRKILAGGVVFRSLRG
jgi:hypothetical protein